MHGCSRGHVWLLLGGMHGCSWGACVVAPRGVCMVAPRGSMCGCSGGHAWLLQGGHVWDMTRYEDTINERAVRILLECILVCYTIRKMFFLHEVRFNPYKVKLNIYLTPP